MSGADAAAGAPARPYRLIRVAPVADGVARIALDNPARRNAIGVRMVTELHYALSDACGDAAVRSIVLTGEGAGFCAGGDFQQMAGGGADADELPPKGDYADLLLAMVRAPKPIVARVNGHAMGGGLGLVAASHFAVGVLEAKLGTPEIDVGLFPMMIMAVLRRVVPQRRLLEMMLFGEKLGAEEAVRVGILNRAVPAAELDAAVAEITGKLGQKSPVALRLGLEAFAAQEDLELERALPLLRERLGACFATEDFAEGIAAFLQKRPPVWKGR
ncbi:MAG: enoyl-CoA hydratase/isomerase family protein [Polyangiaceae bacterium]|nr:enoyl-CoA hydratase/isomerase family protein [Polyangiaceae bacterium]